jgi:DNA-binding NarL/FixJ family response regulator
VSWRSNKGLLYPSETLIKKREEHLLPPIRILVADDHEGWRRQARLLLRVRPELQVICEASDGPEAVQKAEELRPDLILLDISLPKLNGLEAARRIRQLAPESKILFLTQESSADVAQEALSLGALGYVVKARAGTDLLAAVQEVLQGKQFVSSGLSGHSFTQAADAQVSDRLYFEEALATPGPGKKGITRNHEVQFYPDDSSLLAGFASFVEAALKTGNAVIVVATESHRESLLHRLRAGGVDIDTAIGLGRYISLDVAETLSTFMVNDQPDPVRFFKAAGDLIVATAKAAKGKHSRISACGECAPTLCAQGKPEAAIQLERFWDEIARTYDVDILCGYVLGTLDRQPESHIYERICAEHSAVRSQ